MKLFFGIKSETLELRPELSTLFVSGDPYLSEISMEDESYLGKFTSEQPTLDELDALQTHIFSIAKRLNPQFSPLPCHLLALLA